MKKARETGERQTTEVTTEDGKSLLISYVPVKDGDREIRLYADGELLEGSMVLTEKAI